MSMQISYTLNGRKLTDEVDPVQPLTEYLREKGCFSVKRGCETSNCGLCTVLVDGRPVLSCATLTARINGKTVETLEGPAGCGGRDSVHTWPTRAQSSAAFAARALL